MGHKTTFGMGFASMALRDRLYVTLLLVVFGGIVLHAPLTVWLGTIWPDSSLIIKAWKEIILGVTFVLGALILTRRHQWGLLKDRLLIAMGAFAALNLLLVPVLFTGPLTTVAGLFGNLRYFLFFGLVYVALRLYPQVYGLFVRVFLAGAAVVLGFALLQATVLPANVLAPLGYGPTTIMPYLTVDQNPNYVRINSTLRGPNPLGAYATVVLAVVLALWLRGPRTLKKYELWVVLALAAGSMVALWASYSRSAALGAVAAVAMVLWAVYGRRLRRSVIVLAAVIGVVLIGSLVVFKDTQFVSQVILHEDPGEGNDVNSNQGHAESLVNGTRRVIAQPFGAGIGSTGSASLLGDSPLIVENQYLYVAHETGWVGLGLFLYIQYTVLARLWRKRRHWLALGAFASGVGLCVVGLFLPVWADDTVGLVWWGLAAVALAAPMAVATKRSRATANARDKAKAEVHPATGITMAKLGNA